MAPHVPSSTSGQRRRGTPVRWPLPTPCRLWRLQVWALGKLGHHPGALLMDRTLSLLRDHFQSGNWWGARPCQHPCLPRLLCMPLALCLHALTDSWDPISMSQVIWALAKLQHDPGSAWLLDFQQATAKCLGSMTPQGLSNTAWGLATLKVALLWRIPAGHAACTCAEPRGPVHGAGAA